VEERDKGKGGEGGRVVGTVIVVIIFLRLINF